VPRKPTGERLEKVVSTKISVDDFILLEKYARMYYNQNSLVQPTISHMLRWIIKRWAKVIRDKEIIKKAQQVWLFIVILFGSSLWNILNQEKIGEAIGF
jgi:hypothetical protein